ncbi:aminotransferase class V-fold PLP-dependent enzyme [Clostridium hydrogeniformans]|uniref:aminotransferase class V-fold PLP-dependent enzyme n=1 Tax=Clostridium hydrogeniformans TaxID=349933 RepID=UPI000484DE87|nr:aminotransferase class V-fold PLP-dependent enzyme [Clostridium hydrogeniformans]
MLDLQKIRKLFPGIYDEVPLDNGKKIIGINFDNAATTPPFIYGIRSIEKFASWYSSVHRGAGYKSKICSDFYEDARDRILKFFNAPKDKYEVIFTKNTTEGLNLLSHLLVNEENKVLSTFMEHHANDLPWRGKCHLEYVNINKDDGTLDILDLEDKLKRNEIKYLTVSGASNVTGCVNDINKLAKLCHKYGTKIIVDGAQLVPHKKVNMLGNGSGEEVDFLVFSAHKMYAPFGIGVVIGLKEELKNKEPFIKGGGTIKIVTENKVYWDESPARDEGGTPNVFGVVALLTSMQLLDNIGMDNIHNEEVKITNYILNGMKGLPIDIYGPLTTDNRLGIITFNVDGMGHSEVANSLCSDFGISVRNGCFCAHPYVEKLLGISEEDMEYYIKNYDKVEKPGMVRISLGVYNTLEEAKRFLYALRYIIRKG